MTYEFKHIPFPSIPQYRDVIRQIREQSKYHSVPVPTVTFKGSVKLHGTNAAVVLGLDGEVYAQSRERVITPLSDNAGFAIWLEQHKDYFKKILKAFISVDDTVNTVQIYGEWCGGNIQKGVGLSKLNKMFVIFGLRVSKDAESQQWLDIDFLREVFNKHGKPLNVHLSTDFPVFFMNIDFNKPEQSQQSLIDLTIEVEKDCPVARKLLSDTTKDELIGEGIVWEAIQENNLPFSVQGLRFKTKGEKYSVSKVKVLVPVDLEKVASVDEFVEKTCTENRLKQGLDKLKEMGLEQSSQNTGTFLKWVMSDCIVENLETLSESGLTTKDVSGKLAAKARLFYLSQV